MADRGTSVARFLADPKGAVTIEFTTLVPFFVFLMVLFFDVSTVYLTHSEMYSAARDIARRMSTGELTSEEEVRSYAAGSLFLGDRTYTVDADFGAEMRCSIVLSLGEAAIFGKFFQPILGRTLIAAAVTSQEPRIIPAS